MYLTPPSRKTRAGLSVDENWHCLSLALSNDALSQQLQSSDKHENPAQGTADAPSLSIPKPFSGNPDDHGQHHPLPNSQDLGGGTSIQPGFDKFAGGVPGGVSKTFSGDDSDPDGRSRAVGPSPQKRSENDAGTTGSNAGVWDAYAKGQWENGQWVPKVRTSCTHLIHPFGTLGLFFFLINSL